MALIWRLSVWAWLCLAVLPAWSQGAASAAAASAPVSELAALAAQPGPPGVQALGRVVVMNREVVTLRGSLFGIPAQTRATESEARIRKALRSGGKFLVSPEFPGLAAKQGPQGQDFIE